MRQRLAPGTLRSVSVGERAVSGPTTDRSCVIEDGLVSTEHYWKTCEPLGIDIHTLDEVRRPQISETIGPTLATKEASPAHLTMSMTGVTFDELNKAKKEPTKSSLATRRGHIGHALPLRPLEQKDVAVSWLSGVIAGIFEANEATPLDSRSKKQVTIPL